MRKIYFLLFTTVISISLFSCKKGNNEKPKETFSITGKWNTTKVANDVYYKDVFIGSDHGETLNSYVDHIEFNTDGTGTMSSKGVMTRKFKYVATDADIHFSNVFAYDASVKKWFSVNSFMSFITNLNADVLEFSNDSFYYQNEVWNNLRYDKIKFTLTLSKAK